ncbi:unnamed protein product [Urochloa decumbens]|uniref:DPL2-like protein n=1 Tax=Urochloa decumbens TaxID=240449 RepID=A0ABC9FYZ2_9POAL
MGRYQAVRDRSVRERERPRFHHSARQPQPASQPKRREWSGGDPAAVGRRRTYPTHVDPRRCVCCTVSPPARHLDLRRQIPNRGLFCPAPPPASTPPSFQMASEDSKDMLKNVDWKTVGGSVTTESSQPVIKKRFPKKIRQVPECYFLPRRSLPSALAIYGAVCAAGVGAGMLLEVWINKKIKEDGGIIWEMDK